MIIGTFDRLCRRAHVSSDEPAIVLFGYLRHGLVGRGVELFGLILLFLNFPRRALQALKARLACLPTRS